MIWFSEVFYNGCKSWHPRHGKMAILKKSPSTSSSCSLNSFLCFWSLTLSKWYQINSCHHISLLSVLFEIGNWIRTGWKYENERRDIWWIIIASTQIECWWINERLTNLFSNEVLNGKGDLISSNWLQKNHLLEWVKSIIPFTWHLFLMRLVGIKDLLEFLVEFNKVGINTFECFKLVHAIELLINLIPFDVIKPISWIWLSWDWTTWAC